MGQAASGAQANIQNAAARAAAGAATQEAGNQISSRLTSLTLIRTIVGYVAVFGVWSAAIANVSVSGIVIGIYLFFIAVPITLLELAFFINKLTFCAEDESRIGHYRGILNRIDTWKRGVLYGVLALPCFIPLPFISFFAILFGLCLILLSVLYCAKTFQPAPPPPRDDFDNVGGPSRSASGKMQDPAQYNDLP